MKGLRIHSLARSLCKLRAVLFHWRASFLKQSYALGMWRTPAPKVITPCGPRLSLEIPTSTLEHRIKAFDKWKFKFR